MIDPSDAEGRTQDVGVDIVETTLDIEEKRGNFESRALEYAESIHKHSARVKGGKAGEGATLVGMKDLEGAQRV